MSTAMGTLETQILTGCSTLICWGYIQVVHDKIRFILRFFLQIGWNNDEFFNQIAWGETMIFFNQMEWNND